jgi:hypothetical protein
VLQSLAKSASALNTSEIRFQVKVRDANSRSHGRNAGARRATGPRLRLLRQLMAGNRMGPSAIARDTWPPSYIWIYI